MGGTPKTLTALLLTAVVSCCAVSTASASSVRGSAVILHPGQSKKIGSYTVACTTGKGKRTKTRIVLSVGFQVKVKGTLVRCASRANPTPTPTPTPPPAAQGTRGNPFSVGVAGTTPGLFTSSGSTWTIVVNSTNPDAWPVVLAANEFNSPPPPGAVDFMVNLSVTLNGTQTANTFDLAPFLSAVGASGVAYGPGQQCGVLPSPSELDYSDFFPGATFGLNYCWQVSQSDAPSLELYWSEGSSPGPFWTLH